MDRYSIVIKPILISWRFVVNIKSRAVFSAVSNASVQRNLVGGVRRCWFILPCDWSNSRHPHDKSDVKLKLATALPPAFSPRFRQFISVYFGFSLVLSHFHFFSIRSGNYFVITQSKSDHKKDPLNTSHC